MNCEIEHRNIEIKGVTLHTVLAGPEDGKPVLMLHGFPEFWYGWNKQIPALAKAGYRVIVPDQRGYNLSGKPSGIGSYSLNILAGDVIALITALGYKQIFLVGHDWGAIVSWWTAQNYPDRIKKLVIMNVPHPYVMKSAIKKMTLQTLKSWYVFFFQLPYLPELAFKAGAGRLILTRSSLKSTFTSEDLEKYKESWKQPGAVNAMINWYRAMQKIKVKPAVSSPDITMPTLVIWGKRDIAIRYELAQKSVDLCKEGRLITFNDATHWVQHDKSEEVNNLLIDFLK